MNQATAQGLKKFMAMKKLQKKAQPNVTMPAPNSPMPNPMEGKAVAGDPLSNFDMMQDKKKK